ncbi:MAG: cupredoxin domain-containing protein [Ilumatobacter sp.]
MGPRFAFGMTLASVALLGCGSDDNTSGADGPARSVEIAAVDFAFRSDAAITISAGETIEFIVENEGSVDHQMEVLTDANRRLGMTERIAPGRSDTVTVTFAEPGVYRVICDIDDHRTLGQIAEFTVADAN